MEIVREINNISICCHIKKYEPADYGFHWHDNYEICRVERGLCGILVDGEMVYAEKGDLVCISEHTVHRLIVDTAAADVCIFQFPLKILLDSGVAVKPLQRCIRRAEIERDAVFARKLDSLFDIMLHERRLEMGDDNVFFRNVAASTYFLLMRSFTADVSHSANRRDRREFYGIVDYIGSHLNENLSVKALSEKLFIPRGRLAALFAKYSGVSMNDYVNSLRVQRVNKLLRDGVSVTEAALESGFQSIRTFNSIYKKLTGMTPSEYAGSAANKDASR